MNTSELPTIAAISTPPGEGGIAVVRISGKEALGIADRIVHCSGHRPSRRAGGTFVHGWLVQPGDQVAGRELDEVIALVFRAPRSYTCEDVVELQVHGGRKPAQRALRVALAAGAEPADPGEFTRRAFLNGRIDLIQAEAVADLIRARSDRAASAAVEQIKGALSNSISTIYDTILELQADMEATLDFEEDELPDRVLDQVAQRVHSAAALVDTLLNTWEEGHLLREGALVVISGQPNVGKSTLMNALLGRDRVIVTDTPGTTRDSIEEEIVLSGLPIRLVDTAGLRATDCSIEQAGIDRAQRIVAEADLNLHVVDGSRPLDEDELSRLSRLDAQRALVVLNKADLKRRVARSELESAGFEVVECTARDRERIEPVESAIVERLGSREAGLPHAVISERHRLLLVSLKKSLEEASRHLAQELESSTVLAAEALREGLESLARATGRVYSEDLLDSVFSRFCIGK